MLNDEYIINKFYIKDNRCGYRISGKTLNNITEEYNYVINRFTDSSSIKESIQRIYYKIEEKINVQYVVNLYCGKGRKTVKC